MKELDEELIYRYVIGDISIEEKYRLDDLIASSEDVKKAIREVKELLRLNDILEQQKEYDVSKAYQKLNLKIEHKRVKRFVIRSISRVAAILLLPLLLSNLYLFVEYTQKTDSLSTWAEVASAYGVISKVLLPDSSVVWLNSGTTLKYPLAFGASREVQLDGEAYFEVKSDPRNPFWVKTRQGYAVKSYGTGFNVRAYEDDLGLDVFLSHGCIDFVNLSSMKAYQMKPGDFLACDYTLKEVNKCVKNELEVTGWRDGKMVFRDTPLKEIVKQLSRHYNVTIQVQEEDIKEYRYTATFTTESLEQVLNLLKLTAPLEWEYMKERKLNDSSFTKPIVTIRRLNPNK